MRQHKYHNLSGEDKNQLLVTCDKQGNILGEATREECHGRKGKTHLAFMAFVIDEKGRVILTKRSKNKSLWANYWDASVVSHVLPNETIEEAANRRGKEELGVDTQFKKLGAFYYFAKQGNTGENEYCYVLIGKTDQEVKANPVEIEEVKKLSFLKLKDEFEKSPEIFTPWFRIAFEKFDLVKYL